MNLLEAINDSIIEDGLIEEAYYACLEIEEALQEGHIMPADARQYLQTLMESANIRPDLMIDVINGGPFSRLARAGRIMLPLQENKKGFADLAAQVKALQHSRAKEKRKGSSRVGASTMNIRGGFSLGYDRRKAKASSSGVSGIDFGTINRGGSSSRIK